MKINYFIDEKLEFFESILAVNGYWKFQARKWYDTELQEFPYEHALQEFFAPYKDAKVFSVLTQICNVVLDCSDFLYFPSIYSIENGKFVLNDTKNEVVKNFGGTEKVNELLSEMEKLYEVSKFHDFFSSSIDKSQILLSTEMQEKISLNLNKLQSYIADPIPDVNIYLSPLILGNYVVHSKKPEINIVISPAAYKNMYIWENAEDTVFKQVLECSVFDNEKKLKDFLSEKYAEAKKNNPSGYQQIEARAIELVEKAFSVRIKVLFQSQNAETLIKNEEQKGFLGIKRFYNNLISLEKDGKFYFSDLNKLVDISF